MALIYCVEDDEGIRELITCALKTGGFESTAFESSKELFSQLEIKTPDLILLDIMLPDEDGINILKKIRSNTTTGDIPVIMLTAKTSEVDKVIGLEEGADDYVTKPFGIMELLSRIKAVLRRYHKQANLQTENVTVKDLSVNIAKHQVNFKDKTIELTFKEFELLVFLMKNQSLVMSREQILEKVWGYNYEGESRTVDMHIKTLRKKLEAEGCIDYIKTVRGVGYSI